MKRKAVKTMLIVICVLAALWAVMFVTDYIRCSSLQEPVFVLAGVTADDGGSGEYRGLGYTVDVEKYIDSEGNICVSAVEMKIFDKVVAASIT